MAIQFYGGGILFGDSAGANTDKMAFHELCCCEGGPTCGLCSGDSPTSWSIDIANLAAAGFCNADCLSFNGAGFIVSNLFFSGGACIWYYQYPSAICSQNYLVLVLTADPPHRVIVTSELDLTPPFGLAPLVAFVKSVVFPISCMDYDEEDIPEAGVVGGCDHSTATCSLTAIA